MVLKITDNSGGSMMKVLVMVWVLCALISYGAVIAFFENKYVDRTGVHRCDNRFIAVMVGLGGPLGLILAFLATERFKYGFKYW